MLMRNINIFIVNFFTKALELNSMLTTIPQKKYSGFTKY